MRPGFRARRDQPRPRSEDTTEKWTRHAACNAIYTLLAKTGTGTGVRPISLPVGPQQPPWPSFGQNGGSRYADQHRGPRCPPPVSNRARTPPRANLSRLLMAEGDGSDRYGDARPPIHLPSSRYSTAMRFSPFTAAFLVLPWASLAAFPSSNEFCRARSRGNCPSPTRT